MEESFQLYPRCIPDDLHDRKNHGVSLFYYNPLILEILESLLSDPEHQIFFPTSDNACGIPEAAMDELLPIKMAYKLTHSDKLDIGTLNREYFPKIGNMIGKTIRIGKVT